MPCLVAILLLFAPRLALLLIFFFTNWFSLAFHTILWPFLGFLFLPYTTLAWMGAMFFNHHQASGVWLIIVLIGFLMDLGTHGGAARRRRPAAV